MRGASAFRSSSGTICSNAARAPAKPSSERSSCAASSSGECRVRFDLAAQDGDRLHEFAGHAIAGDLGPGQCRRQAGLARAGRAGHHNHGVRPAFGDDSIELRRWLEIPGIFQDLGLSRTVLPEDLAGVVRRGSARGRAGRSPRCTQCTAPGRLRSRSKSRTSRA